jgi:hypothetical protein
MSESTNAHAIALYRLAHPDVDAVTKKQAQDFLLAELVALTDTVAALTAENERLKAIHELLADDIAFVHRSGGFVTSDDDKSPLEYSVLCSDTFAFACADAEPIPPDEAVALARLLRERPTGVSQADVASCWVARKRGLSRGDFIGRKPSTEAWEYVARAALPSSREGGIVYGPFDGAHIEPERPATSAAALPSSRETTDGT